VDRVISLSPLELDIMKSLWRRGSAPVKDVRDDLRPRRPLAYTTVMTVLDRMFKKGIVARTKRARAHVYSPRYSESEVRAAAVSGLLKSYFDGSQERLKAYLNGVRPLPTRNEEPAAAPIDDSLL
jgi:predicted transcriptional regulator